MVYRFRAGAQGGAFDSLVYKGNAHVVAVGTPLRDIYGLNPLNEDFNAADFDGDGDYVTTTAPVKVRRNSVTHPDGSVFEPQQSLTVQVWFKADDLNGTQVLLSNRNSGGFSVYLDGDQLVGDVFAAGSYRSTRAISRVKAGVWYSVTFRAYETKADHSLTLTLHIDHRLEGMELLSLASGEGIVDSTIPLTLGIEAGQNDRPFNGRIHAATVRNYAMPLDYLHVPVLQDGGELIGAPSFDDGTLYAGSGVAEPEDLFIPKDEKTGDPGNPFGDKPDSVALRATWHPPDLSTDINIVRDHSPGTIKDDGPLEVTPRAFVPFVSDDYVVQGVAHSCEAGQPCSRKLLYLSSYWKTPGFFEGSTLVDAGCDALGTSDLGTCSRQRLRNRSVITEIDLDQMRVTRCWRLAGSDNEQRFGHVGGIAYFEGDLYVADSKKVARYTVGTAPTAPMPADQQCQDLYRAKFPSGNPRQYGVLSSSFISLSYDQLGYPEMLVGSSGNHDSVRVYRYPLTDEGNMTGDLGSYWIPYSTQGVEMVYEHPNEYLIVNTSEGVYKYPAVLASTKPPNSHIEYYPFVPRYLEDTARVGNVIWSASESSARYYQLRPFDGPGDEPRATFFFPFIYTFEPDAMTWRRPTDFDFKQSAD